MDASALSRIVGLADFEPPARAALETAVFDYVAGGSWDEITLAENDAARRRGPDGRAGRAASGRRARDRAGRVRGRNPVHRLDGVVAVARGGGGGRPAGDPLVPALHASRSR